MPFGDGTGPTGQGPGTGRGRGMGRGGGRGMGGGSGLGVGGNCRCPKCGATTPHQRAVPCYQVSCPQCGTKMVRG